MTDICSLWGLSVRSAEDGFSALSAMRREVPDILLSDLNMPGMSGFELLSVVRRRFPAIKVIAMSGAFTGDGAQLGVAADAFYRKGSSLNILFEAVEAMSHPDQQPSPRKTSSLAPIWISGTRRKRGGQAYVFLSCPECLRTFPLGLGETDRLIREANCAYCGSSIHYAILQPADPATPQLFQRAAGPVPVSR